MIMRMLIQIDTRAHCTTLSGFGVSRYSPLTAYGLYLHLSRVFLMVVYKGNSLIMLLEAIDGYAHLAVHGADLQDSDMVKRFPVSVVQGESLPLRRKAGSKA